MTKPNYFIIWLLILCFAFASGFLFNARNKEAAIAASKLNELEIENYVLKMKLELLLRKYLEELTELQEKLDHIRIYKVKATAYSPFDVRCIGWEFFDGLNATMTKARVGAIAVDPKVIPLHSIVYVPEYGYYYGWTKAEDVGPKVKGYHIDIAVETYEEAKMFGVKWPEVLVIEPEIQERS